MSLTHFDGVAQNQYEELDGDGAISIKWGTVVIQADVSNVAHTLTIADPTAGDDDGAILHIIDTAGAAHTLAPGSSFGNGGSGENLATFSGVKGDNLTLRAWGGYWYVIGAHQVAIS